MLDVVQALSWSFVEFLNFTYVWWGKSGDRFFVKIETWSETQMVLAQTRSDLGQMIPVVFGILRLRYVATFRNCVTGSRPIPLVKKNWKSNRGYRGIALSLEGREILFRQISATSSRFGKNRSLPLNFLTRSHPSLKWPLFPLSLNPGAYPFGYPKTLSKCRPTMGWAFFRYPMDPNLVSSETRKIIASKSSASAIRSRPWRS